MRMEYENGQPVIHMEREDVKVKITFPEKGKDNVKKSIVELLTMAYENRAIKKKQDS